MKYTKTWMEFLTEDRKYNEYLESLPIWREFIAKFNQLRRKNRSKIDSELLKKSTGSLFHDSEPHGEFIDEWSLERIHANWTVGNAKPIPYGEEEKKSQTIDFKGLKEPEIGDILVQFRGYAWLFKPNKYFNYMYSTSAAWGHDANPNKWDDISYFDNFVVSYIFKFQKDEIPLIFRNKLSRKIHPTVYDTGTGYKKRDKIPNNNTNSGTVGYSFK